jgi:hypothetical protein
MNGNESPLTSQAGNAVNGAFTGSSPVVGTILAIVKRINGLLRVLYFKRCLA